MISFPVRVIRRYVLKEMFVSYFYSLSSNFFSFCFLFIKYNNEVLITLT